MARSWFDFVFLSSGVTVWWDLPWLWALGSNGWFGSAFRSRLWALEGILLHWGWLDLIASDWTNCPLNIEMQWIACNLRLSFPTRKSSATSWSSPGNSPIPRVRKALEEWRRRRRVTWASPGMDRPNLVEQGLNSTGWKIPLNLKKRHAKELVSEGKTSSFENWLCHRFVMPWAFRKFGWSQGKTSCVTPKHEM